MPYLHLKILSVFLFVFQFEEVATLKQEKDGNQFYYGKVISPLSKQNLNLTNLFIFEGTYSVKYQYDILDLISSIEEVTMDMLKPEVCSFSKMLTVFCTKVHEETRKLQMGIQGVVVKMSQLRSKSNVSEVRISHLPVLSNIMTSNGTSGSLHRFTRDDENFSLQVEEGIENAVQEISRNEGNILEGRVLELATSILNVLKTQRDIRLNLLTDTISKCRLNVLPTILIKLKTVKNSLIEMRQKLRGSDLILGVSFRKLAVLPLVDCYVTNDNLLRVTVNIPLRKSGNWSIQSVNPIPFMFKGEKCRIFPVEQVNETVVALIGNKYEVINEMNFTKIKGGLHVVRWTEWNIPKKYSCLLAELNNQSLSEFKNVCAFPCQANDLLISIVKLGEAKYLVSGADRMNIKCTNTEEDIPFPDYGSLEVDVGVCKCQFFLYGKFDQREIQSKSFCDEKEKGLPKVVHVIPSQWTYSPVASIGNHQWITSLNEVFNPNWWQLFSKSAHIEFEGFKPKARINNTEENDKWGLYSLIVVFVALVGLIVFLFYHFNILNSKPKSI